MSVSKFVLLLLFPKLYASSFNYPNVDKVTLQEDRTITREFGFIYAENAIC